MSCYCGHSAEEHGNDPAYPGSTSCIECDCIAYNDDPGELPPSWPHEEEYEDTARPDARRKGGE